MIETKRFKHSFFKSFLSIITLTTFFFFFGCNSDDDEAITNTEITVTAMNPTNGPKNTVVTFTGTNLTLDNSTVQIFFDDIEATIQEITNTTITAIVPARSYNGNVQILVNNLEFSDFTFNYEISDIQVNTYAGGEVGYVDGDIATAKFNAPLSIASDPSGNVYVADFANKRIRKITPEGVVSTFAGSGENGNTDGLGEEASFLVPSGLAVDTQGNVYVADAGNDNIRKITPNGQVTTLAGSGTEGFADGNGTNAQFNFGEVEITVDEQGNIYATDSENHKIRKIDPNGNVTTVAGTIEGFLDGNSSIAMFDKPSGIDIDNQGNLYIADASNHKIRKIDTNGNVTTIAGSTFGYEDSDALTSKFGFPSSVAVDDLGNVYISGGTNKRIRKLSTDNQVSTIAGNGMSGSDDGSGQEATFAFISSLSVENPYSLLLTDIFLSKIRRVTQE